MPIPLEMTYFHPLHFVIGVCKQQQMPSQFAKVFGDALIATNRWTLICIFSDQLSEETAEYIYPLIIGRYKEK